MLGRRRFLDLTLKNALLITAGRHLRPFFPEKEALPHPDRLALRFALASDGHFGQPNTDHVARHALVVKALNGEKAGRGLDFTVVNGDLIHDDPQQLPLVKKAWDDLHTPWYPTHGNHDKVPESEWHQILGHDWYYGFEQGEAAFVVFNTATVAGDGLATHLERHQACPRFMSCSLCPQASKVVGVLLQRAHSDRGARARHAGP